MDLVFVFQGLGAHHLAAREVDIVDDEHELLTGDRRRDQLLAGRR